MKVELTRLRAQLAACAVVANGGVEDVRQDGYAWSPAYEAVCRLRRENGALLARNADLAKSLEGHVQQERSASRADELIAQTALTLATAILEREKGGGHG